MNENGNSYFFRVRVPRTTIKTFLVSVEGEKTEMQYFENLNYFLRNQLDRQDIEIVPMRSEKGSAPLHVLDCMKKKLRSSDLTSNYEAWLVVDRNSWKDIQLDELQNWADKNENHNFAISNPFFEYWLLLHFEDGMGIVTKVKCREQLNHHLEGKYKKEVDREIFNLQAIETAIVHAKQDGEKDSAVCREKFGCTTVYKLVENILNT